MCVFSTFSVTQDRPKWRHVSPTSGLEKPEKKQKASLEKLPLGFTMHCQYLNWKILGQFGKAAKVLCSSYDKRCKRHLKKEIIFGVMKIMYYTCRYIWFFYNIEILDLNLFFGPWKKWIVLRKGWVLMGVFVFWLFFKGLMALLEKSPGWSCGGWSWWGWSWWGWSWGSRSLCGWSGCGWSWWGRSLWGRSWWGRSLWGWSWWGRSLWGWSFWGSSWWGRSLWGWSWWGRSLWGWSWWGWSWWGRSLWGWSWWGWSWRCGPWRFCEMFSLGKVVAAILQCFH